VITALVLVPLGQFGAIWFILVAGLAVLFLTYIARWYAKQMKQIAENTPTREDKRETNTSVSKAIKWAVVVLVFLVFARSWYMSAISNFYAFFVIDNFDLTIAQAQVYIFTFLFAGAAGTFFGGALADRFGKRNIILISLLGPAPLALLLPYVGSVASIILLAVIGFMLLSSFSVTVVYAQQLVAGIIGTMSGLMVGLGFGMGSLGSALIGSFIDLFGLMETMIGISLLPLLGFLTYLLPTDEKLKEWYRYKH